MRQNGNRTRRNARGGTRRTHAATPAPSSVRPGKRLHGGATNRDRFDQAYKALFSTIFRVAYRISGDSSLAEDLTHEAFLQLLLRDHPLPNENETKYWLLRVIRNMSLNLEKRRARERRAYERAQPLTPKEEPPIDSETLAAETRQGVQTALRALPEEMRSILVLREYSGLSYREIAAVINITENNVKVRLHRARQRMATLLADEEQPLP